MAAHSTADSTSQDEIRQLHEDWFAASHRKDLDASMAPIAATIVSYEHSAPTGLAATGLTP
jgi:ketosteroid isomerase-like protein